MGQVGTMVTHDGRMERFTDRTITILDGVLISGGPHVASRLMAG